MQNYEVAEIYTDLRNQALQWQPKDGDSSTLIAVLMETGYPEAVATLIAISDGAVSLYFSNGGGIIGAGEHDAVRHVAREFLLAAAQYVPRATPTDSFPLPKMGDVRFYLVTTTGIHTAEAREDDLGYRRHPFAPLFHQAHKLIAEVRQHAPK